MLLILNPDASTSAATSTSAAASTSAFAAAGNAAQRAASSKFPHSGSKGSKNNSHDEVEDLLKSVSICLPFGSEDRQVVAHLHSEKFPANKHDTAKLKHKFYEIANKKPSTSNPEL